MRTALSTGLLLFLVPLACTGDDHGNTPLAATPIDADGELVSACIETAGDMDYFLFSAVAGRTYRFVTSHLSEDMDTLVYLFAADGSTILQVDDDSAGDGASRMQWTCRATGTYFLMIRHAQSTTGTGCYSASLSLVLIDDHGDDALTATSMDTAGTPVDGYIETIEDTDVFFFSVEQGYNYTVRVAQTADSGAASARLTMVDNADPSAEGTAGVDDASIEWSADRDGIVFVEMTRDSVGGYELSVTRDGYADDVGNDPATARALDGQNVSISGSIDVLGDEDWFRFDATQGSEYTITTRMEDGSSVVVATLFAADGVTVLREETSLAGETLLIVWDAPSSGTVYFRIRILGGIGTYVLSISTTLQLQLLGTFNPLGYSLDVWADGTMAYLVVGSKGFLVVDAEDPEHPREIGSNSTRGYAQGLAVSGEYAFIANRGDGLTILDISDPTRPFEVSVVDTPGSAQDVTVVSDVAYVADQRGGLQIIDVAHPENPRVLGAVETSGFAQSVAVSATWAYVAAGDAGLALVDVSDPTQPVVRGSIDLRGDASDVVVFVDGLVYVAAGYRGVRIVDVSNPDEPVEVGSISASGEACGLDLVDGILYAAQRTDGLTVYRLTDPLLPEQIAAIDTPGYAVRVAVTDGLAYIADQQEGLQIVQLVP